MPYAIWKLSNGDFTKQTLHKSTKCVYTKLQKRVKLHK